MRSRSDHRFTIGRLSTYIDGRLTLRERARAERHLGECAECRKELASLRGTVALLRSAPPLRMRQSFVLPRSAAVEQARYRRWDLAYGLMRGAAVAMSFLLVMLISGDALFSSGLLFPASPPAAPQRAVSRESAVSESAAPELMPTPVVEPETAAGQPALAAPMAGGGGGEAPESLESAPAVVEKVRAERVDPPAPAAEPALAVEAPVPQRGEDSAPQPRSPEAGVLAPRGMGAAPPASPVTLSKGAAASNADVQRSSPEPAAVSASAPAPVEQSVALATPTVLATPVALGMPPASATRSLPSRTTLPVQRASQVAMLSSEAEPTRPVAFGAAGAQQSPLLWRVWYLVRIVSGLLLGLLLMLLGALVWVGRRRRV